ncbi:hypothetical protein GCM10020331_069100 [Ectobacillus funiculus]
MMVTPPGKDGVNPHILAAAHIAGVDEIYSIGGAQGSRSARVWNRIDSAR